MCFVPRMGFNFNALLTHFRPNGNAGYEDVKLTESCQPAREESFGQERILDRDS